MQLAAALWGPRRQRAQRGGRTPGRGVLCSRRARQPRECHSRRARATVPLPEHVLSCACVELACRDSSGTLTVALASSGRWTGHLRLGSPPTGRVQNACRGARAGDAVDGASPSSFTPRFSFPALFSLFQRFRQVNVTAKIVLHVRHGSREAVWHLQGVKGGGSGLSGDSRSVPCAGSRWTPGSGRRSGSWCRTGSGPASWKGCSRSCLRTSSARTTCRCRYETWSCGS